ncbi:MAG TPA: hypothetical protein VFO29_01580 [Candidatus Rubrimentiphilum sp.]|nr:hypothetical protein [Candidatus Rubrimentiphilum sp.]
MGVDVWRAVRRFPPVFGALLLAIAACSAPVDNPNGSSELEMSRQVKPSVSAAKIAGNPLKYVGVVVKLRCTIVDVPSADFANATCGPKDPDFSVPSTANVDYTDPDSIAKYEQRQEAAFAKSAEALKEQGSLVLEGEVATFDANQVITLIGTVVQPMNGKNRMGVEQDFPAVRIDYVITPNSPSTIQARVHAQTSCVRRFELRMDVLPMRGHPLTDNDISSFLDRVFDGIERCDVDNGFAFMPSDEISKIGSGELYPVTKAAPTALPSAPPKTSPLSSRIAYQAKCVKYMSDYYPWFVKHNAKNAQQHWSGLAADLFNSLEDCDDLSGLGSVDSDRMIRWAKKALR